MAVPTSTRNNDSRTTAGSPWPSNVTAASCNSRRVGKEFFMSAMAAAKRTPSMTSAVERNVPAARSSRTTLVRKRVDKVVADLSDESDLSDKSDWLKLFQTISK